MPWTTGITHQHSHDVPGRAAVSSQRQGVRKRKAPVPEGPRPLDLLGCSPATACRQLLYEVLLATAQCPVSSLPHRAAICFLLVRLFTQERRKNKRKGGKEEEKKPGAGTAWDRNSVPRGPLILGAAPNREHGSRIRCSCWESTSLSARNEHIAEPAD